MKHALILNFRNVKVDEAPLLRFEDAIAVPSVGDELSYAGRSGKVTDRIFSVSLEEIRVVLTIDGDGVPEDPVTHQQILRD